MRDPRLSVHAQEKAEQRNPDEFYFAMEKSRTKEGIHVVNSAEAKKYTQVRGGGKGAQGATRWCDAHAKAFCRGPTRAGAARVDADTRRQLLEPQVGSRDEED